MSLFDAVSKVKSQAASMTPWMAFATSLFYIISADGKFEDVEVAYLVTALGGESKDDEIQISAERRKTLEDALKYGRSNTVESFLVEAAGTLNRDQKLCVLLNMIDCALSSGEIGQEEIAVIMRFKSAFSIPEAELKPMIDILALKNKKEVLG